MFLLVSFDLLGTVQDMAANAASSCPKETQVVGWSSRSQQLALVLETCSFTGVLGSRSLTVLICMFKRVQIYFDLF